MGWMSLSVISTAVLYGMGTNGILARRYPKAAPISDALALGFVLALPVVAWSRMQRRQAEEAEHAKSQPTRRDPGLILGLSEGKTSPSRSARVPNEDIHELQKGIALQSVLTPTRHAGTMARAKEDAQTAAFPALNRPANVGGGGDADSDFRSLRRRRVCASNCSS
jgi:hypothetical protein